MKKVSEVLNRHFNQQGLGGQIIAGQILMEAERLYPGLFQAISVRENKLGENILHLKIVKADTIKFKMIEGKLLKEINEFSTLKALPGVDKIRLSYLELS